MNEQEAKDAAWSNSSTSGLPVSDGTAYLLRRAFDEAWQLAIEYRQQDSPAAVVVKNFNKETLNIAVESIERLQAENQRLRAALEKVGELTAIDKIESLGRMAWIIGRVKAIASAALGGE
jgi:hypothetical protein